MKVYTGLLSRDVDNLNDLEKFISDLEQVGKVDEETSQQLKEAIRHLSKTKKKDED